MYFMFLSEMPIYLTFVIWINNEAKGTLSKLL